jgi:hypothetical protein
MHDVPAFTPIRAFCIAEAADRGRWNKHAIDAGLLFDRCRLVDFSDELPDDLLQRLRTWTDAAVGITVLSNSSRTRRVPVSASAPARRKKPKGKR